MKPYGEMHQEWRAGDPAVTAEDPPGTGSGQPLVNHLFTGYERDFETGYDYAQARYYDPEVARFMAVDPMFQEQGQIGFSPYHYGAWSPTILVDPTGLAVEMGEQTVDDEIYAVMTAYQVMVGSQAYMVYCPSSRSITYKTPTTAEKRELEETYGSGTQEGLDYVTSLLDSEDKYTIIADRHDSSDGTWGSYNSRRNTISLSEESWDSLKSIDSAVHGDNFSGNESSRWEYLTQGAIDSGNNRARFGFGFQHLVHEGFHGLQDTSGYLSRASRADTELQAEILTEGLLTDVLSYPSTSFTNSYRRRYSRQFDRHEDARDSLNLPLYDYWRMNP